jgi:hypothetical protein
MRKRWVLLAAVLVLGAGSLLLWFGTSRPHEIRLGRSLFTLTVFLLAVLGLLELIARRNPNPERRKLGFLEVVLGADGRISTSKTVVALWTAVFASSLVLLSGLVWFGDLSAARSFGGNWDAYLILLGGPFASAVAAKGIVLGQMSTSPGSKSSTNAQSGTAAPPAVVTGTAPGAADLITDDAGDTDLIDVQYVVFSVVAVAYFVGSLTTLAVRYAQGSDVVTVTLPSIPPALVALTSAAALTYVGNKAIQAQGLRTVTMTPNPASPSAAVTVQLVNLPPTATTGNIVVVVRDSTGQQRTVGPAGVDVGTGTLVFAAPAAEGDYQISVSVPDSTAGPLALQVKAP